MVKYFISICQIRLKKDRSMKQFLRERLQIALDGVLHINEVIAIAIFVVALLLVILLIRDTVKKRRSRETRIFSNRKNRYKSRLGKKNKY